MSIDARARAPRRWRCVPSPWTNPASIFSSSSGRTRSAANEAARPPSSSESRTPRCAKPAEDLLVELGAGAGPGRDDLERQRPRADVRRAEQSREAVGELRVVHQAVRDVDRHAEVVARLCPELRRAKGLGDDEERQLADERRALDVRHELGGRDEGAGRGAARRTSASAARGVPEREVDDRLVHDDELVLLERRLDVANDAGVHAAAEQQRLVHGVALRRVHLAVGPGEELVRRCAVRRVHGPADARVDLDGRAADAERATQRVPQARHEGRGLLVVPGAEGQHHELVATDPRDRVAGSEDRLEPTGERAQDGIPGAVPAHVVDVLEAVEIDCDERERPPRRAGRGGEPARSGPRGARGSGAR